MLNISEAIMESISGFRLTTTELFTYPTICFLVILWCRRKWNHRHFDRLAAKLKGPPAYPIIGSALQFIGTPEELMSNIIQLIEDYTPGPVKIRMGPYFGVGIIKPDDIQIVLNSSKALEKDRFYNFTKNIFGKGLLTAPVDKWRKHRRLISPLFNSTLLTSFFPTFNEKSKILVNNLKSELNKTEPFNLWDYIAPINLNSICQNAMGYNLDNQSKCGTEFTEALIKASELDSMRISKPWLYPGIIFSLYLKLNGHFDVFNTLYKLPLKMIQKKREEFAQRKIENKSNDINVSDNEKKRSRVFLDLLFELNEDGANFSNDDFRDEVITMMIGGSETSAIAVCFCLLLLAIYPDIQDKVYDEIYDVLGDGDQAITIEHISQLLYLDQVLKETLRLFPPIPLMFRELQDDVNIVSNDIVLPKGSSCYMSPFATNRDSASYPNPNNFNPENFSPENIKKRHTYSFLSFSRGPRGCLGTKYAMLSMKVILSTFLRNYSVHTHFKLNDIKLKLDLMLSSSNGYPVTIRTRDRRRTNESNQNAF